jgi:hypothetical protein
MNEKHEFLYSLLKTRNAVTRKRRNAGILKRENTFIAREETNKHTNTL